MLRCVVFFICNIIIHSYTTTVLKKYHEVGWVVIMKTTLRKLLKRILSYLSVGIPSETLGSLAVVFWTFCVLLCLYRSQSCCQLTSEAAEVSKRIQRIGLGLVGWGAVDGACGTACCRVTAHAKACCRKKKELVKTDPESDLTTPSQFELRLPNECVDLDELITEKIMC